MSGSFSVVLMTPFVLLVIAICYIVAFLLEVFRLRSRGAKLHGTTWRALSAAVGFVLHTGLLYQIHIAAEQPIGGAAMFFLASAWGLILLYLLWLRYYPNIPFGIILLPLAALLLIAGREYLPTAAFETTGLSPYSLIKMLHLVSAAGGVIALSVFIICRFLYFLEVRLLRKKRSLTPPIKLPSLEWSLTVCRASLTIALCCLCLCALGGIVLNVYLLP